MDIPKADVGGSNRGAKGCPAKRVRVYPRRTGAATECRPKLGSRPMSGKWGKLTEKQRTLWSGAPQTDCLIPAHDHLDAHDGPFPLRTYLYRAAGRLLPPGRANARRLAE